MDEYTRQELVAEVMFSRRYQDALMAHPDPRDPDYPGDMGEAHDDMPQCGGCGMRDCFNRCKE